jgi:hypothetical protein
MNVKHTVKYTGGETKQYKKKRYILGAQNFGSIVSELLPPEDKRNCSID